MNDAINQLLWQKLCGTFVHCEETSIINNGRQLGCVNQTYNFEMYPSNDQNWQMVSKKKESKISKKNLYPRDIKLYWLIFPVVIFITNLT